VRLRQSALPAPPRQCLASSAAGLELEPVTPARQDGIARFSRASCVRGMSVGLARRTLSSGKHDTNATGKSNGSSRLPAFSFRGAAATERRGRTTHATRISRRRTAIRREHGDARPRPREICSLSQSDMFTSAHRRDCLMSPPHATARRSSARFALPERRSRTTVLWQLGDSASPSCAWEFRKMTAFRGRLERLAVRFSPSHRRLGACPRQAGAEAGAIP
jgi:hypothetical protein